MFSHDCDEKKVYLRFVITQFSKLRKLREHWNVMIRYSHNKLLLVRKFLKAINLQAAALLFSVAVILDCSNIMTTLIIYHVLIKQNDYIFIHYKMVKLSNYKMFYKTDIFSIFNLLYWNS